MWSSEESIIMVWNVALMEHCYQSDHIVDDIII